MLLVELLDELVSGAWTAAWPLIRTDLGLSYVQVGLLTSVPYIFGCILEPPLGLLGDAWNRRRIVRAGGIAFAAALLFVALGGAFLPLLLALMLLNPASGAFVELSQATLMDLEPTRRDLNMARWTLAGSIGAVAGPVVLAGAGMAGFGWRGVLVALAAFSAVLVVATWRVPVPGAMDRSLPSARPLAAAARDAIRALRRRDVRRWLVLLQLADLMLDVLQGFLALYFVDAVGVSDAGAAVAVVVWLTAGLAGDALAIPLLARLDGARWLRASAWASLPVLAAFLLVPGAPAKLVLLAVLALLRSGWYPALKARLYGALPERSATVMALGSIASIVVGLLPLTLGLAAQAFGLGAALWLVAAAPAALLVGVPRRQAARARVASRQAGAG
ncbi:MAG TPA: MFS transporter [Longimicrobiales bacterium]